MNVQGINFCRVQYFDAIYDGILPILSERSSKKDYMIKGERSFIELFSNITQYHGESDTL